MKTLDLPDFKLGVLEFKASRIDAYVLEIGMVHTKGDPTIIRLSREQLEGVIFLGNSFLINDDYMNKKFFAPPAHSGDS